MATDIVTMINGMLPQQLNIRPSLALVKFGQGIIEVGLRVSSAVSCVQFKVSILSSWCLIWYYWSSPGAFTMCSHFCKHCYWLCPIISWSALNCSQWNKVHSIPDLLIPNEHAHWDYHLAGKIHECQNHQHIFYSGICSGKWNNKIRVTMMVMSRDIFFNICLLQDSVISGAIFLALLISSSIALHAVDVYNGTQSLYVGDQSYSAAAVSRKLDTEYCEATVDNSLYACIFIQRYWAYFWWWSSRL